MIELQTKCFFFLPNSQVDEDEGEFVNITHSR